LSSSDLLPDSFDKPFKTYDEMLEIMSNRHIDIANPEFAKTALSNLSYYGLVNGYKESFLAVHGSDDFLKGTKFEDLYILNMADVNLNNIIFKYILYIERALKSKLSYVVSEKFGVYTDITDSRCHNPNDYLYIKNYTNSNNNRYNTLYGIKQTISNNRQNNIIEHYMNEKNHLPAWIITYKLSFGQTIQWYSILRNEEKIAVCDAFINNNSVSIEQRKEFLKKALTIAKEYRNKIAHGNRTINISGLPQLPKNALISLAHNALTSEEYNQGIGQSDLFAIFLSIIILFDDPYLVSNFYQDIEELFERFGEPIQNKTIFEIFNIPSDSMDRLYHLITSKFHVDPRRQK